MLDNGGYIERTKGEYVGELSIDGVNISPIVGFFFKDEKTRWLWVKRKKILEYDMETSTFITKNPTPMFEAYLQKQTNGNIAYKGEFVFFKFKYSIVAFFDDAKTQDKLIFAVERMPIQQQNILNRIKEIKDERKY